MGSPNGSHLLILPVHEERNVVFALVYDVERVAIFQKVPWHVLVYALFNPILWICTHGHLIDDA